MSGERKGGYDGSRGVRKSPKQSFFNFISEIRVPRTTRSGCVIKRVHRTNKMVLLARKPSRSAGLDVFEKTHATFFSNCTRLRRVREDFRFKRLPEKK